MQYRGRTFVRESVYVCGDYIDGDIFPVFQPAGKRRCKCGPTSEVQERLNQRNAEKKLARLVHANFTGDDMALHLTYGRGQEPETKEEAQRDLQNYLRRVKRRYKKLGVEFKYISCTEYGKTTGRIHHHLIISGGMGRDDLEKLWGKGYANSKRLQFGEDGVTGLARYMAKDKHFYKRWNQSKNLIIPEARQQDGTLNLEDVEEIVEDVEAGTAFQWFEKRYPGFMLVEASWERNCVNRGAYIRFTMRRIW